MKTGITISVEIAPELREALVEGAIVSLRPEGDNAHDKNAIRVYLGEAPVGYIIHNPEFLLKGEKSNDALIKHLTNASVAGANARLLKKRAGGSEDAPRWHAEVFFLPVWEKKDGAAEEFEMTVDGNRVMYSDKAMVLSAFDTLGFGDLVLKLHDASDGTQRVVVWRRAVMAERDATPAGEIKAPPEAVLLALQNTPMLEVAPVPGSVSGTSSYKVKVSLSRTSQDEFNDDMNEVVRNCVLQVREIKERVSYLLSQNVPPHVIRGVLHSLRYQPDSSRIIRPKQMFLQTAEEDVLTRALGYHLAGKNLRLVGEKGSGKNTLIQSVCWVLNQPLCRVQGNADMDKIDLLGGQTLDETGTKFELSAFVETLISGGDVVLDEINAVKPEIAICLHSLADDARSIEVPGYGFVKVHPASRIWATMNEEYIGTGELNSATADRFVPLFLSEQMNLSKLLTEMFPDADPSHIAACSNIYNKVLKAVQDGRCTSDAITTRGYIDAMASVQWIPIRTALLDNVANRPQDKDDRHVISDFIRAMFPA